MAISMMCGSIPRIRMWFIAGDDGGLWRSQDGGTRWAHQVNLPVSQFYHVSVDNADPYHVYGGLQDNSSWVGDSSYPGGVSYSRWENMFGGDGFWMFEDPSDPGLHVCRSAGRRNRASEPLYAREALDHAVCRIWRKETALQLEHSDSHESQRKGHDLHRGAVPVSLARSWAIVGTHFAGPDDERSGEAEAGGVRRHHRGQLRGGNAHHRFTRSASRRRMGRSSGLEPTMATCRSRAMAERPGPTWWESQGLPKNSWVSTVEASRFDEATAYVNF